MPNTFIYKVAFIDNDYYTNTYNTAFFNEWNILDDAQKERFIELASIRVKSLASRPFVDLNDLEQEQGVGVQQSVARLIDYWMEYGLDLNRISGSVSLGSFSASQTVPSDPDYIPKHVFDLLQDVGLYSPIGFVSDDIYRFDDDRDVTYGVRFKTLERVKDITIDKTSAEAANKNLVVPTTGKVLEEIRGAKLSPFVVIGEITEPTGSTVLPTEAELEALFVSGNMVLNDGTKVLPSYPDPSNPQSDETVPVTGEAIRVYLQNGTQEITDFDGTAWRIDNSKNAQNAQVVANTAALKELNDSTSTERAIKASEGDIRYIRTDGSNEMSSGYTPTNSADVMTKGAHDSELNGIKSDINDNLTQIGLNKITAEAADTLSKQNGAQLSTNTAAIATNVTNISNNTQGVTNNVNLINTNTADIAGNSVKITTNTNDIQTNTSDIVILKGDDASHTSRLDAIESAQNLDDKVWVGSIPLTGSDSLTAITDEDGNLFDFVDGKRLVLYIKHTGDNQGKSTEITVGDTAGGSITIPTGNQSDTLKIDLMSNGILTSSVTNGNTSVTAYEIYRLIEAKAAKAVSASYSKTESDGKYTLKTTTAALDTRVATNLASIGTVSTDVNTNKTDVATNKTAIAKNITDIAANTAKITTNTATTTALTVKVNANTAKGTANATAIAGKQASSIPASSTTSKTVSGAIDEVNALAKSIDAAYKVADTAQTTAITSAYKAADAVVTTSIDTKISAALATDMIVTFDDSSTATYKLGK